MVIIYNVYANDGAAGPVDYATSVATTSGLTYVSGPLPVGSDTTFAVRARDVATNLEEANTDAQVRVVLDASGDDVSGRPNPPHAVALSAAAGGGCLVSWGYVPASGSGDATGFEAFLAEGPSVAYTSPAATVPFVPGQVGYKSRLPGPYPLSTYTAAVRSYNATGSDGNTVVDTRVVGLPTSSFSMDMISFKFI